MNKTAGKSSSTGPTPGREDGAGLYTVSSAGFSALADAYARDSAEGLWFLSMNGSQMALKAIWANFLKQPSEPVWIARGPDAGTGGSERCLMPGGTAGTWTTRITRLPGCGKYHAVVYPRLAEQTCERSDFLIVANSEEEAPALHYRFLDRRTALPLLTAWSGWLWKRALERGEAAMLESAGVAAYRCEPDENGLAAAISYAVGHGALGAPAATAEFPQGINNKNGVRHE